MIAPDYGGLGTDLDAYVVGLIDGAEIDALSARNLDDVDDMSLAADDGDFSNL